MTIFTFVIIVTVQLFSCQLPKTSNKNLPIPPKKENADKVLDPYRVKPDGQMQEPGQGKY